VQLNVHVPKEREHLLGELERVAEELNRTKSQLVLDAVESYLKVLRGQITRDFAVPGIRALSPAQVLALYPDA
jgi:hypothetical protein